MHHFELLLFYTNYYTVQKRHVHFGKSELDICSRGRGKGVPLENVRGGVLHAC